jgi:hypothetical protein
MRYKEIGRILILSLFIILASFGMGMFGVNYRERFMHKTTQIELIERKEEDDEDSEQNEMKG